MDLVAAVMGERPADAVSMETYGSTLTYRVSLPQDTVYLKASAGVDVGVEAWVCTTARRAGVPAPEVIAVAESAPVPGGKALLTRALPGRALCNDDPAKLAEDAMRKAGVALAQLRRVRVPGWGPVMPSSISRGTPHGEFGTWPEALSAELLPCLTSLIEAAHLAPDTLDLAITALERAAPTLDSAVGVLCHGDLNPSNIFVDDRTGQLTGIVDFGDSMVADLRFEVARLAVDVGRPNTRDLVGALCAGLGCAASHPVDELYRAIWAAIEAAWSLHFAMSWTTEMCALARTGFEHLAG